MQLAHCIQIPVLLCVTKLICSFSTDVNGRLIGFCYADGMMFNNLMCVIYYMMRFSIFKPQLGKSKVQTFENLKTRTPTLDMSRHVQTCPDMTFFCKDMGNF